MSAYNLLAHFSLVLELRFLSLQVEEGFFDRCQSNVLAGRRQSFLPLHIPLHTPEEMLEAIDEERECAPLHSLISPSFILQSDTAIKSLTWRLKTAVSVFHETRSAHASSSSFLQLLFLEQGCTFWIAVVAPPYVDGESESLRPHPSFLPRCQRVSCYLNNNALPLLPIKKDLSVIFLFDSTSCHGSTDQDVPLLS